MTSDANQNILDADKVRILVIDDTRLSQHVIQQRLMDNGYGNIEFAEAAQDIRGKIKYFQPHIIILDWMMPGINGLSLTKMIRAQDKASNAHTYVLMVTGKDSESAMVAAFKEGVNDFIAKADVVTQLVPRMIRAISMLNEWRSCHHNIENLQGQLREQAKLITLDPVSQLPSRYGFTHHFKNLLDSAVSRNHGLSCLLVYIANYSELEQTLPPKALEQVVKLFSSKLLKQLRPTDFVARTDTSEFMALIQTERDFGIVTLDRIERSLNKLSLKTKDGFHILNVKSAGAKIMTDAFSENWSDSELREFLKETVRESLPVSTRIRKEWPHAKTENPETADFLYTP